MVRSKYRYITIQVVPNYSSRITCLKNFKSNDFYKAVYAMVKRMHGDFGLACLKTGFLCKYCNVHTGVAVLKVRHGPHRFVSSALPFISEMNKENVQISIIGITATLHRAFISLKNYQQKKLESILHTVENDNREEVIRNYENINPLTEFSRKE